MKGNNNLMLGKPAEKTYSIYSAHCVLWGNIRAQPALLPGFPFPMADPSQNATRVDGSSGSGSVASGAFRVLNSATNCSASALELNLRTSDGAD